MHPFVAGVKFESVERLSERFLCIAERKRERHADTPKVDIKVTVEIHGIRVSVHQAVAAGIECVGERQTAVCLEALFKTKFI